VSHLQLDFRLRFRTAFHTTGNRRTPEADKAVALRADGSPVIPATTLKGTLRSTAERLLRAFAVPVCQGPGPSTMCLGEGACVVCRVFGNPRRPSPLRFVDAVPQEPVSRDARSGVGISRQRRAALAQRLFFVETVEAPACEWRARCEGRFADEGAAREAAALVWMAARCCPVLGGGGSRGLGWVESWLVEARLDGDRVEPAALEWHWKRWLGGDQP